MRSSLKVGLTLSLAIGSSLYSANVTIANDTDILDAVAPSREFKKEPYNSTQFIFMPKKMRSAMK